MALGFCGKQEHLVHPVDQHQNRIHLSARQLSPVHGGLLQKTRRERRLRLTMISNDSPSCRQGTNTHWAEGESDWVIGELALSGFACELSGGQPLGLTCRIATTSASQHLAFAPCGENGSSCSAAPRTRCGESKLCTHGT